MRFSTRTLLAVVTCCAIGLGTLVVGYRVLAAWEGVGPEKKQNEIRSTLQMLVSSN